MRLLKESTGTLYAYNFDREFSCFFFNKNIFTIVLNVLVGQNICFRALQAGCKKPLLVRPVDDSFPNAGSVTTLGCLHALYVVCY